MRVYIDTLGCPKNISDSENAAGLLEEGGHTIANAPDDADAILINTCGFINDAKAESIDRILEMSAYKEKGTVLIVSGCLSQRYPEELFRELPEVDIFLGVNEYHRLPEILNNYEYGKRNKYFQAYEKEFLEIKARKNLGASYTSYLKIAEGCDNVCAYCVIPSIRGSYRSRKQEDVVKEAEKLAESGCRELIIVAQDVTAYGIDLYGEYRIHMLLEELCRIDSIKWIRLMYCYEDRITDNLIKTIANNTKICRYLDIPIQHSSDKILSSMNRRSTKLSITDTIRKLRSEIPGIHIRTTLITGFPGETPGDFNDLYEFVREMKFERLGVFAYSKEEGTAAAMMKDQVRKQTKNKRRETIMELQRTISLEHNMKQIGKSIEVLVEKQDEDGTYIGRSQYDAPEIDNSVIFSSDILLKPGDFVEVKITDAFDYDLIGELSEKHKLD